MITTTSCEESNELFLFVYQGKCVALYYPDGFSLTTDVAGVGMLR